MTKHFTPRQMRKVLDATETPTFTPSNRIETLRDQMDRGTFTPTGWIAGPVKLSDEGWLRVGTTLLAIERATPWCWADWWLARGSRELPADWTGPDRGTLDNRASTARAFPISRRRENVTFKHHTELTHLSETEQDELLEWCASLQRPSVSELRVEKQRRAAAKLPPPAEPSPRTEPSQSSVSPSVVGLSPEPPAEPSPEDIALRVELFLSEALHAWATATAISEGVSLAAWIIRLIERERDAE